MTDPIGTTSNGNTAATPNPSTPPNRLVGLADQNTFLKLLVAQVQHQDPLNPQEPVEFVSQLAQFSQLETLLSMRKSLETIEQNLAPPPASGQPPATEQG